MKYIRTVLIGSALFFSITSVLPAQDNTRPPIEHSGLWLGGGLGGGSTDNDEGSLTSGDDSGPAGYFRLGGSVSQHILLGGEFIGMTFDRDGTDVSFANATFTLIYDPALPGGFFAKGGIGFASVTTSLDIGGGTFTTDDEGFGVTIGAGYDVRIGGNLYLTPNVDFLFQTYGDDREASMALFTLGIGMY
jgi:hypothetical protein